MLYLVDDDDDRNEELAVCKVCYPVSESTFTTISLNKIFIKKQIKMYLYNLICIFNILIYKQKNQKG
jgi:hypothetical protein